MSGMETGSNGLQSMCSATKLQAYPQWTPVYGKNHPEEELPITQDYHPGLVFFESDFQCMQAIPRHIWSDHRMIPNCDMKQKPPIQQRRLLVAPLHAWLLWACPLPATCWLTQFLVWNKTFCRCKEQSVALFISWGAGWGPGTTCTLTIRSLGNSS